MEAGLGVVVGVGHEDEGLDDLGLRADVGRDQVVGDADLVAGIRGEVDHDMQVGTTAGFGATVEAAAGGASELFHVGHHLVEVRIQELRLGIAQARVLDALQAIFFQIGGQFPFLGGLAGQWAGIGTPDAPREDPHGMLAEVLVDLAPGGADHLLIGGTFGQFDVHLPGVGRGSGAGVAEKGLDEHELAFGNAFLKIVVDAGTAEDQDHGIAVLESGEGHEAVFGNRQKSMLAVVPVGVAAERQQGNQGIAFGTSNDHGAAVFAAGSAAFPKTVFLSGLVQTEDDVGDVVVRLVAGRDEREFARLQGLGVLAQIDKGREGAGSIDGPTGTLLGLLGDRGNVGIRSGGILNGGISSDINSNRIDFGHLGISLHEAV